MQTILSANSGSKPLSFPYDLSSDNLSAENSQDRRQLNSAMINFNHSLLFTFIAAPDGRIIDANPNFLRAVGLSDEDIQQHFWQEFIVSEQNSFQEIMKTLQEAHSIQNLTLQFKFPSLSPSCRMVILSAKCVPEEKNPCILFNLCDINHIPQISNDLSHMEELKTASEIAAGVGHEIRNPMTAIRGFLQRLQQKKDFVKYQDYFKIMLEELDRSNQIISEFLALTKEKSSKAHKENLNAIIQQIFPLLQINALAADKEIVLELMPTENLLLDGKEIRQLLLNLVRNGLEAMTPGKKLTIQTYQQTKTSTVLAVKDQGCGIPAHLRDKIGTPFFTTKENGTGLGLSICYTIARKNNAVIDIDSSENGTTFYITFKTDRI